MMKGEKLKMCNQCEIEKVIFDNGDQENHVKERICWDIGTDLSEISSFS
jgi:hypothetical protein